MRIALIVGIDYYDHVPYLFGCVNDAMAVREVLVRHGNGSVNFDCKLIIGTGPNSHVERDTIKDQVAELFKTQAEIALLYFSGHGYIEPTGGYLLASDASRGDHGLSLTEVLTLADVSPAQNKVIILDSCHSGIACTLPGTEGRAVISENLTVLTASTSDQYATEANGRGVFTSLMVDALKGGAANLTGDITPGSIYAYIDQSLGAWEQRPVFKTNVQRFVSLRKVPASIKLEELRQITDLFPASDMEFRLNPTFEPEAKGRDPDMPPPDPKNVRKFTILQRLNRLNLVIPVDAPHMWHAAMQSKSCKLTTLGQHYHRLVKKGRI